MKRFLKVFLIVLTIIVFHFGSIFAGFFIGRIRLRQEARMRFSDYKSDFEIVNEYVLSISSNNSDTSFHIIKENHKVSSLIMFSDDSPHGTEIFPEEKAAAALNNVNNARLYSFDFIEVTSERITYSYGVGSTWYIYSRNGEKVKYVFSPKDDKGLFDSFRLNDDWYYFDII